MVRESIRDGLNVVEVVCDLLERDQLEPRDHLGCEVEIYGTAFV